jgi:acetyl-CoA synthetase
MRLGKIFGSGSRACMFIYDIRGKFGATELLPLIEKYEVTTFAHRRRSTGC